MMSPVLLDYLLRGDVIGHVTEKGLFDFPNHGALAALPSSEVSEATASCLESDWLTRSSGFYPSLSLSSSEELRLASSGAISSEISPERAYRARLVVPGQLWTRRLDDYGRRRVGREKQGPRRGRCRPGIRRGVIGYGCPGHAASGDQYGYERGSPSGEHRKLQSSSGLYVAHWTYRLQTGWRLLDNAPHTRQ